MIDPSSRPGFALLLALGCGGGGAGPGADAGALDGGDDTAPDLSQATWEIDRVSETAGASENPELARASDGRLIVAWEEPDALAVAISDGDGWDMHSVSVAASATYSDLQVVADPDGGADVVFAAALPDSETDVYYLRWDGAALSAPVNLTPGQADRRDAYPTLVRAGGVAHVYYESLVVPQYGDREVRHLSFADPASPSAPETILEAERNCGESRAVRAGGATHLVIKCIPDTVTPRSEVLYLSDRSGELAIQVVDDAEARNMLDPDIAVAGGGEIHIAFGGNLECEELPLCREIYYSRNLAPVTAVTNTPAQDWRQPRIVLDGHGRVILVFHSGEPERLHWTFRGDTGFFRPQQIEPAVAGVTTGPASFGVLDPETGLPIVAFERSERGASTEIWIARLMP